jgi:hypothetical protein
MTGTVRGYGLRILFRTQIEFETLTRIVHRRDAGVVCKEAV